MAALATNNLTLLDWAKLLDPDGTTAVFANILGQTNEILTDCVFKEGNLPTGHRVSVSTGLPTAYYRSINQGIPSSKAKFAQIDCNCAIIEARSEIDRDLATLNGNSDAFRLSHARMFIEAMNQAYATGMFYGDAVTDPKQFTGLSTIYSSTTAGNGQNVILGGSAAPNVNTSVWLVGWGDETVFCPFPKGSRAGLQHENLGRQTSVGFDGVLANRVEVLADWFQWKPGLCVKDWRFAGRIANLEVARLNDLAAPMTPTGTANLIHLMARLVTKVTTSGMARFAWYVNRTAFASLMRLGLEKSSAVLAVNPALDQFGKPSNMLTFMGIPIRRCDAILNTEALIS